MYSCVWRLGDHFVFPEIAAVLRWPPALVIYYYFLRESLSLSWNTPSRPRDWSVSSRELPVSAFLYGWITGAHSQALLFDGGFEDGAQVSMCAASTFLPGPRTRLSTSRSTTYF